jgi:hypothetical protein
MMSWRTMQRIIWGSIPPALVVGALWTMFGLYGAFSFYSDALQDGNSGPGWTPIFNLSWLTLFISVLLALLVAVVWLIDFAPGRSVLTASSKASSPVLARILTWLLVTFAIALAVAEIIDRELFSTYGTAGQPAASANQPLEAAVLSLLIVALVPAMFALGSRLTFKRTAPAAD